MIAFFGRHGTSFLAFTRSLAVFGVLALGACDEAKDNPDGGTPTDGSSDAGMHMDSGPQDGGGSDGGAGDSGGRDGGIQDVAFGLDLRPANPTCEAPERPSLGDEDLELEEAFPGVTGLGALTDLRRVRIDGDGARVWVAAAQNGRILAFGDGHVGAPHVVLESDALTRFRSGGERGLLGVAADPRYPTVSEPSTLRLYVNYTGSCGSALCSYISRFEVTVRAGGSALEAGAEEVLIRVRQPASNHNGGALVFGTDGFLYASLGDGGDGNDPRCNALNLRTPLGKILRLDVSPGAGYVIPANNPFRARDDQPSEVFSKCDQHDGAPGFNEPDLSRADPCPEIVAYGLRNAFRMSVDRATGFLWLGDVGQGAVEEIHRLDLNTSSAGFGQPNHNLGWPRREGHIANPSQQNRACDLLAADQGGALDDHYTPPVFVFTHGDNPSRQAAVGGVVYRGQALGDTYVGRYVFADFASGELWALADPYNVSTPRDVNGQTSLTGIGLTQGFAEDDNGELYVLLTSGPRRMVPRTPKTPSAFPQRLSETGCVDPANPQLPGAGLIPYGVNAPLWSDGATKERYLAIPEGTRIERSGFCDGLDAPACAAEGNWALPVGSVLVKVFRLNGRLLETRLLMRHADGDWAGYTYVWDEAQREAHLIKNALTRTIDGQTWTFPSREDCLRCHTQAAGGSLGLETAQLNGDFVYPDSKRANQLRTLEHIGLFTEPLEGDPAALPVLPAPGLTQDPELASRAYLHSNCAMCHRPGGGTQSAIDLRFTRNFEETGVCDTPPGQGDWSAFNNPRIFAPGAPERSLLVIRVGSLMSERRMPPLATTVVDAPALTRLQTWIQNTTACP